ncbi:MAG: right-handed parallel beta-helix repeat-containing protein, partial [bacterium]|nr:right-handed parallel beta-helix repeat-containing protein [bacterium]
SSPTITDCFISNNMANYYGGGICCDSSSPTITDCFISNNMANYYGGGICCYNSSPTITNCTISNNSAKYYGGGIYCWNSSPTVTNSILWEDSPGEIYLDVSSSINITYSNIQGGYAGEDNINTNPLFVGGGDYHLTASSPCIDKGSNDAVPTWLTTDLDGNPRIVNGIVDMGAYEFQGTSTQPSITVIPNQGYVGSIVTVQGSGISEQGLVRIDFGTHQTITTTETTENGTFSVTFICDNQPIGTKTITVSSGSLLLTSNFLLLASPGTITGNISYTGTKTGIAYVVYSTDPFFEGGPEIGSTFSVSGAGSYSFTLGALPVDTYYIACWFDAEPPYGWNTSPMPGDVLGLHGGTITIIDGEVKITGTPTPV